MNVSCIDLPQCAPDLPRMADERITKYHAEVVKRD
jgi:hypothetical protein